MKNFIGYLVVFAVLSGCKASGDTPGFIVTPGMVYTIPYDPYDAHPVLGSTLMAPPEGSVPYQAPNAQWAQFAPGDLERARAAAELANPLSADKEELARGKHVFDTFCAVCHGPQGFGDGPIIGRFPNPPSLVADRAKGMPDGEIYHIITHGRGLMPNHAAQVLPTDRWRAILHIRSLQGVTVPPSPATASTDASQGAPQ